MFYVYILQLNNNKLYTGFTSNLKQRFSQHQSGSVESTRIYRPVKLIHYEEYILEEDARRREIYLKTSDGKNF